MLFIFLRLDDAPKRQFEEKLWFMENWECNKLKVPAVAAYILFAPRSEASVE